MNYPAGLEKIINFYRSLPGIGEKNAIRLAIATYEMDEKKLVDFSNEISTLKQNIKRCNICGNISDSEVCSICSDETRDKNVICVLEDFKSVFSFEKSNSFNGTYHILGGLISPMDNINPDDLNIKPLIDRVKNLDSPEVIVALKSSIEGEMTMLYLKKVLDQYNVKVTRL
ncbi:MAG: recombination mediator RecR [Bacilli bacterium]|nr:recombination mediator RecR [Bacilli bacterium]